MEALILIAIAAQVAQRSYQVASSVYRSLPKAQGSIVIEITTSDGKTSSKEIITPTQSSSSTSLSTLRSTTTSVLDTLAYHLQTCFLFTYSDAKTVLIPWTLFGIGHALSGSFFNLPTATPSTLQIMIRLPQIMAWLYLNLLPFCIGNQRNPTAVLEDSINKAWRPLPAKRITPTSAAYLMAAGYIVALAFSLRYGGVAQCLTLAVLGYMYNDMGAGDNCWVARHLLNGLGFISFGSGAMEVAFGRGISYSPVLVQWLRIIALVVFTGIQTADMYDQEGDALVKRSTLPLVLGDAACRWTIAISVLAWSVFCPYFWAIGYAGYVLPIVGGCVVAKRTLTKKTVEADRKTYKLWNLWLVAIYCLPLAKVIGAAITA